MIETLLIIIFIHFVADFMCQTDKMAQNKSKSNYWLSMHVVVYTAVTMVSWIILFAFSLIYVPFTAFILIFVMHWITDYTTSRISSKLYQKGDIHNFFVIVGLDQVLHYIQLFLVYKYLVLNSTL
jgi:hypothetical protein